MVEVMIGVAITCILALIAIPRVLEMQLKAKRAELPANVNGIKHAEMAYDATFDEYITLPLYPRPDSALDKNAVEWTSPGTEWTNVAWRPDGLVRGNYQLNANTPGSGGEAFLITARCDVDDDDAFAEFTATDMRNSTITETRSYLY